MLHYLITYLFTCIDAFLIIAFTKTLYKIDIKTRSIIIFIISGSIVTGSIVNFFDTIYRPLIFIIFYLLLITYVLKLTLFRSILIIGLFYLLVTFGEGLIVLVFMMGLGYSLEELQDITYLRALGNIIVYIPIVLFMLFYKYVRPPVKRVVFLYKDLDTDIYKDKYKLILCCLALFFLVVTFIYILYKWDLFSFHFINMMLFLGFIILIIALFFNNYKFVSKNYENESLIDLNNKLEEELSRRKQAEEELQKARDELEVKVRDRTAELKKAVAELLESEKHFRQMVEFLPSAIFVQAKNKVVFANSSAAKIINLSDPEKLIGKPMDIYFHPRYSLEFIQKIEKVIEKKIYIKSFPSKILQITGKDIDVELTFAPFKYQGKQAVQIIMDNVTERKMIEEELLRANKLENMALMAGGIAHDFNNIFSIIQGNNSLAMIYKNNEEKLLEKLAETSKAVQQASELTSQLQLFARGGNPIKKVESIETLVKEITNLSLSGSNVQCEFFISDDLYLVEIDKVQISQVINNLIINAIQSMPDGGKIRVYVENIESIEGIKHRANLEDGSYVRIIIQDEGVGIASDDLQKIFDPFYTSKDEGTGLGLAISYTIIKKHEGYITVESEPGKGTTFYIYLPAAK